MRIHEIELASPNPAAQLEFYAERLDLPRAGDGIQVGETVLRFVQGSPARYHLAFAIPENQIEDARRWLQDRAAMLSDEIFDFDFWNAHAVYFEDADGNVLELIARHDLANATAGTFTSASLLEANEVGLAVADPPAAVRALERGLGLPVFSGDRSAFTAVGGERGLLIVVPSGRTWFPTERPAVVAPIRVVVAAPRGGEVRLNDFCTIVGREADTAPPEKQS